VTQTRVQPERTAWISRFCFVHGRRKDFFHGRANSGLLQR